MLATLGNRRQLPATADDMATMLGYHMLPPAIARYTADYDMATLLATTGYHGLPPAIARYTVGYHMATEWRLHTKCGITP